MLPRARNKPETPKPYTIAKPKASDLARSVEINQKRDVLFAGPPRRGSQWKRRSSVSQP
jgi:hypothetical protein